MFSKNLIQLRKEEDFSQEEIAEKLNVSRQTISKWESGLSTPNLDQLILLSKILKTSIDELAHGHLEKESIPEGKFAFGILKIDEKNKITIPETAMKIFELKAGDSLILLGDEKKGLALVPPNLF